jgi:type II secretion system protein N
MKLPFELPPWWRRVIPWIAWPAFYLFCLGLFARCTFPYNRIAQRAVATFNASEAPTTGRRIEIGSMTGHWLFGVKAREVRFISPPPPPGEDGKPLPPKVAELASVWASVSPLRRLFGTLAVSFGAEAGDGTLAGRFVDAADRRKVELSADGIAVEGLPLIAESVGVPLFGRAFGNVELDFPEKRLSLAEGKINLTIEELGVGDGRTKIRDLAALPRIAAGKLELDAEIVQGKVDLKKLSAKGPDLEVDASGQVRLRDLYAMSAADLSLRFKFEDKYKSKNDVTKGLFGEPGSSIPGLLDLDPRMKQAKQDDGSYVWGITGQMARPTLVPGGSGGSASSKARPVRRRPKRRPAE